MRILLFADIHIGNIKDTRYVYNTITNIIDKEVMFKQTDLVVILGDYFHRLFKVNEEFVSLAIDIMSYLIRACLRSKTKIRIVYGTESHEMNQYKLFNYHITSSNIDMRVIDTVTEETINNHSILYVPEEYIYDKRRHYKKFFEKQYDYIFGHGIIEDGMPGIVTYSVESNKNKEKRVPHFKSGELSEICKLCIFGHYHIFSKVNKNVYYLGSLFRNCFGEEEDKGYGIIEDDKFTFIKNEDAYIYKTYEFGPTSSIYENTDNVASEINRIKEENNLDSTDKVIRIRLLFKSAGELDPTFKETIKNVLFNDNYFSLLIKETLDHSDTSIDEVEEIDGWEFVLDNSLSIEDKIWQSMNKTYEDPMSMEKLLSYIDKSLEKIKSKKNYDLNNE